ncbi:MAG: cytochrome C [Pseudomonadota bacterium]
MAPWLVLLVLASAGGCESESRGFVLPPGDSQAGRAAFVALGCPGCHFVPGDIERNPALGFGEISVRLGGPVSRVKRYGELVTAVIHPQASLARGPNVPYADAQGRSPMPDYNARMTVRELVDITHYLKDVYGVWAPHYNPYFTGEPLAAATH